MYVYLTTVLIMRHPPAALFLQFRKCGIYIFRASQRRKTQQNVGTVSFAAKLHALFIYSGQPSADEGQI